MLLKGKTQGQGTRNEEVPALDSRCPSVIATWLRAHVEGQRRQTSATSARRCVKPGSRGWRRDAAARRPNDAVEVRLGRVSSGPNLRERIAYRDAALRARLLRRLALDERRRRSFAASSVGRCSKEHGFHRVLGGSAPTLEVEVIAFDDLRLPSGRAARVQLKVILFEDSGVVFEDTMTVDRPVSATAKATNRGRGGRDGGRAGPRRRSRWRFAWEASWDAARRQPQQRLQ